MDALKVLQLALEGIVALEMLVHVLQVLGGTRKRDAGSSRVFFSYSHLIPAGLCMNSHKVTDIDMDVGNRVQVL